MAAVPHAQGSDEEYEDDFEDDDESLTSPTKGKDGLAGPDRTDIPSGLTSSTSASASRPLSGAGLSAGLSIRSSSVEARGVPATPIWDHISPGDIDVGKRLGGGGFAVVHAGTYKGQEVAIKLIVRMLVQTANSSRTCDFARFQGFHCPLHLLQSLSPPAG